MRFDETKRILRTLHDRPAREAVGRDELEAELLARHASLTHVGTGGFMKNLMRRPVIVVLLIAVTGIAACTVPTETEVEMGQHLNYTFTPGSDSYADAVAVLDAVRDITKIVEAQAGVSDVGVSVSETENGPFSLDLMVWGRGISVVSLTDKLVARWPALGGARLASEPLASSVKTSLGEKLGHDIFHIDVATGTEQEMREQILQQIYATGFDGDAVVDVQKDGDSTTIGVTMTQEGESLQTDDELVIEVQDK